jgi:hypothetical protein
VSAVWIRLTVLVGQEIGQDARRFFALNRKSNLSRLAAEIVHTEHGIITLGVLHQ